MPGHSFAIGKPMNFEAKVPSVKAGERTYVNKCYITPTNSPESPVKYVVVENNGYGHYNLSVPQSRSLRYLNMHLPVHVYFVLICLFPPCTDAWSIAR